jgi:RNA polymerase sigma-70 factor (ECF subfamily)
MDIQEIPNELLIKAADGDVDAFAEIYKASFVFVYNVVLRIAGNRDDAGETAQESFIKIFDNLKHFKFRSSIKTWIYRIAVNTALNARKKAAHHTHREVPLDENLTGEAAQENPVERNSTNRSNKESVQLLLNMLNPDQRTCVVLRDMQGLSYEEIAHTLHININTVRSRLKRAREILIKRGTPNEL